MTSATKRTTGPTSVDFDAEIEPLVPTNPTAASVLRLAQIGAVAGARVAGHGVALAKSALTKSARCCRSSSEESTGDPTPRAGRVRRLVVFGAVGAVVTAGIVVWRKRRWQPAPVADRPPSLNDSGAVQS